MTADKEENPGLFRVLVIDDDEHIRNALSRLLRHQKMDVSTAVDGKRALERLRRGERYDCITVDLLMPAVCGKEFVQTLEREELFPLSRVLIVTAVHNADNATAYIQYGCAGYCGKPWKSQRIIEQILRACGQPAGGADFDAII